MNVSGVSGAGTTQANRESQQALIDMRDAATAQRQRVIEASNQRREIPPPQSVPTGTDTSRVDLWL